MSPPRHFSDTNSRHTPKLARKSLAGSRRSPRQWGFCRLAICFLLPLAAALAAPPADAQKEPAAETAAQADSVDANELTIEQIRARRQELAAAVKKRAQQAEAEWENEAQRAGWKRLSKTDQCWIDPKRKLVIVGGRVCLREGFLEMFACTDGTKEHESVISLKSKAFLIHTGLLAVGAEPKHPVQFRPEYLPAAGTEIEVFVRWTDEAGKVHQDRGQDWVREVQSKKPLSHAWVFGGSSLWSDPDTGKSYYRAESGEVICVSNFPTAMMDLPIESSPTNDELLFEAFTEKLPPRDTPVLLILKPKLTVRP